MRRLAQRRMEVSLIHLEETGHLGHGQVDEPVLAANDFGTEERLRYQSHSRVGQKHARHAEQRGGCHPIAICRIFPHLRDSSKFWTSTTTGSGASSPGPTSITAWSVAMMGFRGGMPRIFPFLWIDENNANACGQAIVVLELGAHARDRVNDHVVLHAAERGAQNLGQ